MRVNDHSRITSSNAVQFSTLDFRQPLEGENDMMTGQAVSEIGVSLNNVQALKKQLEKS
ncbi:hypothetical protein [Lederbergia lenta]|uniref:Uncharacterized protein n=1 Tax=Lederbergia lenta TaxID=1467 RepID=A0A2X4Z5B1_LEDLE|nr:hypothetical protein [Lederbergia lenta]MCM3111308.1 hypothetical protein [Lederbergia lenta]MEC2325303.1 hypothetical protein [Lederbergia lenta]SQI55834.1 Uncharacterised protein [Lederbergia lenta]